jgi:hypothetical protein
LHGNFIFDFLKFTISEQRAKHKAKTPDVKGPGLSLKESFKNYSLLIGKANLHNKKAKVKFIL